MTALDSQSLELLRESLITCVAAAAPCGISLPTARLYTRRMGHRVDDDRLLAELSYLEGKKLIEPEAKLVSPANKLWRITAEGRDYAEIHGLS